MTMRSLLIRPRDPILVRDGRPFGADPGARARTRARPMPGTVAGGLRGFYGDCQPGWDWKSGAAAVLRQTVHGPLLAAEREGTWELLFPSPYDSLPIADEQRTGHVRAHRLLPMEATHARSDLRPLLFPVGFEDDGAKPTRVAAWWRRAPFIRWLTHHPQSLDLDPGQYSGEVERDVRVHVGINPGKSVAEEGRLFVTEGLAFPDAGVRGARLALACRMEWPSGSPPASRFSTLGGERRPVIIDDCPKLNWAGEGELFAKIAKHRSLRLVLLTPGRFPGGHLPDLARLPVTLPAGARIVAAAVPRHEDVSGYDLLARTPKPAIWLAPAGSVYFVTFAEDFTAADAEALWMVSLSTGQDALDGYGLAVPGVWDAPAWAFAKED